MALDTGPSPEVSLLQRLKPPGRLLPNNRITLPQSDEPVGLDVRVCVFQAARPADRDRRGRGVAEAEMDTTIGRR